MSAEVLVVGAGLGGLSAAIRLAAMGHRVTVLEGGERAGGKAGITELPGGAIADTGPSLLTLPDVFDDLFRAAGTRLRDEVELRALEPAFEYRWPDGTVFHVSHDLQQTLANARDTFGPRAAEELERFVRYSRGLWEVALPRFVESEAPSARTFLELQGLRAMRQIDPLRTLWAAVRSQISTPHLRDVMMRYATYNGSDARNAPATLLCIAYVDLALGGYGITGGVGALIDALVRCAERLGVRFEYSTWVESIENARGRVRGVRASGKRWNADAVVVNADVQHLKDSLLPHRHVPGRGGAPSTSGWNAIIRAKRDPARAPHTVLFPNDYEQEFADLFDYRRPPSDPTVYLCAQGPAHGREGWKDDEAVFVMVNAPAEPERGPSPPERWKKLEQLVAKRLRGAGLMGESDAFVWTRTPTDLAERFPGSRGALYGAASTSRLAAFRRPPNRVKKMGGLYLASGSAHPGGGMPLCVLSGKAAAHALAGDFGNGRHTATG